MKLKYNNNYDRITTKEFLNNLNFPMKYFPNFFKNPNLFPRKKS